jgi:hypothetical protein
MSYQAIVSRIKTAPHPNADKLQLGYCFGFQVVTSKEVKDGDLGLFFPEGGVLSDEFCRNNNLYPVRDEEGNRIGGGFFDPKKPRVRAQNFRGEKSQGFWIPLSFLDYVGNHGLQEGDTFTSVKGKEICSKYINPATLKAIANKDKKGKKVKLSVKETPMFPMHLDTKQLKYFIDKIPTGAKVYVTAKLHGSSGRTAYAPNPYKELTWKEKLNHVWNILRGKGESSSSRYKILTGSRRVIKDFKKSKQGFYNKDAFRFESSEKVAPFLQKGETIFYEIVGYVHGDSPIMPPGDNKAVGSKEFIKKFGKTTEWTYGCIPGQNEIYIYNWMISNEDGIHYSYPWEYIESRCQKAGLKPVPLIGVVEIVDYDNNYSLEEYLKFMEEDAYPSMQIGRQELRKLVDALTEDQFENKIPGANHLREGVCLRVEMNGELIDIYKNKGHSFACLEGYRTPDVVDLEEVESY